MKKLLAQACFATGLFSLASRLAVNNRFLILMYHRLGDYDYACTVLEGSSSSETDRYELKRL